MYCGLRPLPDIQVDILSHRGQFGQIACLLQVTSSMFTCCTIRRVVLIGQIDRNPAALCSDFWARVIDVVEHLTQQRCVRCDLCPKFGKTCCNVNEDVQDLCDYTRRWKNGPVLFSSGSWNNFCA